MNLTIGSHFCCFFGDDVCHHESQVDLIMNGGNLPQLLKMGHNESRIWFPL